MKKREGICAEATNSKIFCGAGDINMEVLFNGEPSRSKEEPEEAQNEISSLFHQLLITLLSEHQGFALSNRSFITQYYKLIAIMRR